MGKNGPNEFLGAPDLAEPFEVGSASVGEEPSCDQ